MDFLGPLPSAEYLMVVIDEYSRFPEVEIVTSTPARSTIPKLVAIFARQGIPDVLKSDNRPPPFNGMEFKNFAEHMGLHHRKITPFWQTANGEAGRFMKKLEKLSHPLQLDPPSRSSLQFLLDKEFLMS